MAIYDRDGNFVEESPDGKDYFLSDDGMVKINDEGYQVDSLGNVAFGELPSKQKPVATRQQWRMPAMPTYRPPNFDIRLWR